MNDNTQASLTVHSNNHNKKSAHRSLSFSFFSQYIASSEADFTQMCSEPQCISEEKNISNINYIKFQFSKAQCLHGVSAGTGIPAAL